MTGSIAKRRTGREGGGIPARGTSIYVYELVVIPSHLHVILIVPGEHQANASIQPSYYIHI